MHWNRWRTIRMNGTSFPSLLPTVGRERSLPWVLGDTHKDQEALSVRWLLASQETSLNSAPYSGPRGPSKPFGLQGPPAWGPGHPPLTLGPEERHPQTLISTLAAPPQPSVTLTWVLSPEDVWTLPEFRPPRWRSKVLRPPRPNGALAQNSRVWPTLASWRLGLRVGGWSPPGVPDLCPVSPSFIPIHTASHMLLELAQRTKTQGRSKLPAPPFQSHGTLPPACSPLTRTLYIYHTPSPRPRSASAAAPKRLADPFPDPADSHYGSPSSRRKWAYPAATTPGKCSAYRAASAFRNQAIRWPGTVPFQAWWSAPSVPYKCRLGETVA